MAFYESTFIARQDISTSDVEKLTKEFSELVTKLGGKVIKDEYWGLRNLAYLVKKNKKGHYVMLGIDAPADAVKELDRKLRLHDDVIRNVTIRVDSISKEPSAPIREERYEKKAA